MEAPERIWIAPNDMFESEWSRPIGSDEFDDSAVEYIRADLVEAADMAECAAFFAGYEAGEESRAHPVAPAEVEGLVELRRAKDEATGDPARYPRRRIIEEYHSAVAAAYESGSLVAATALSALQADNAKMRKADEILQGLYEIEKARAEKAEAALAEARAETAAAYETTALLAEAQQREGTGNSYFNDGWYACANLIADSIRQEVARLDQPKGGEGKA